MQRPLKYFLAVLVSFSEDQSGADLYEADGVTPQYDPNETVWDYGDRAKFKGNIADYTVTQAADGTFTVTDNNTADGLNEGTDTISGIEILEFDDETMLLVAETFENSYTDEWGLSVVRILLTVLRLVMC